MFWKLLVAIGTIRATLALEIHLHHRLLVVPASVSSEADVAVPQYSYKGTINLDSTPVSPLSPSYTPSAALSEHVNGFLKRVDPLSSALYQVAMEVPGEHPTSWPFTSVKACHLSKSTEERIWLHVSPSGDPHSLSYWLLDGPADDGQCPPSFSSAASIKNWNTTVIVKSPIVAPALQLRVPVAITADGKLTEPEPEKTFLQKYWMHLLGAFLLITLVLPAPEEAGGQEQGGGSSK